MNSTRENTIVIMAGGTGGHVFPGLAVAQGLLLLNWKVHWIGTADRMEADIVPAHNIPIHFIQIAGVRGKGLIRKLLTPLSLLRAFFQARTILKKLSPDVVLGMGGYASGPGGLATRSLSIPLILHEQNAVFGMTNRYLAKMASEVLTGFPINSESSIQSRFVGNPIRPAFAAISPRSEPHSSLNSHKTHSTETSIPTQKKPLNVLIVGGSLGALALNQIVPPALLSLSKNYAFSVLHQSGKNKLSQLEQAYRKLENAQACEFIDDMPAAFEWADIIICRAGALTVAEVAASGRIAIFVPLPIAVDDHQTKNAKALSDSDAAFLVPQNHLAERLPEILKTLFDDHELRNKMAQKAKSCLPLDATHTVINTIVKYTKDASDRALSSSKAGH